MFSQSFHNVYFATDMRQIFNTAIDNKYRRQLNLRNSITDIFSQA